MVDSVRDLLNHKSNCGDLNGAGDVTNAFKAVMANRTKAEFIKSLLEVRTAAENLHKPGIEQQDAEEQSK